MVMKCPDDFCAFILTHGRPDKVYTIKSLRDSGYTGKVFLVVDDKDKTLPEYKKLYGDNVLVFSKDEIVKTFDEGDNFNDRRAIIYARNACFELAKKVGCKYFIQLDDDYTKWNYKYGLDGNYGEWQIKNLDSIMLSMLNFYKKTPALSVAFAQNGDFIGGAEGSNAQSIALKRKCMNTFICSTDRPFSFFGRINEDVNTYTNLAHRGGLFLTVLNVAIIQKQTQSNKGGMTDLYLDSGTYVKSFYTVMYSPSMAKIGEIGTTQRRLHHRIKWSNAVPVILNESYKKKPNNNLQVIE